MRSFGVIPDLIQSYCRFVPRWGHGTMINSGGTEFTRFLASGMDKAVTPAACIRTHSNSVEFRERHTQFDRGGHSAGSSGCCALAVEHGSDPSGREFAALWEFRGYLSNPVA